MRLEETGCRQISDKAGRVRPHPSYRDFDSVRTETTRWGAAKRAWCAGAASSPRQAGRRTTACLVRRTEGGAPTVDDSVVVPQRKAGNGESDRYSYRQPVLDRIPNAIISIPLVKNMPAGHSLSSPAMNTVVRTAQAINAHPVNRKGSSFAFRPFCLRLA